MAPKKRRGGMHQWVARTIDRCFGDGTFDVQAWLDHWGGTPYSTPSADERNAFAADFQALTEADKQEAKIYEHVAFLYILWNRKVSLVSDLRMKAFADFKASAAEADTAASDAVLAV